MYLLKKNDLKTLLNNWALTFEVYAPQTEGDQVMLLPYEENTFTMEYVNFAFPVKEYFFSQKATLFNWEDQDGKIVIETPKESCSSNRVYFGVRPCDAYGIQYLDKFFLEGYKDKFYERKRNTALIVAVNCIEVENNCFCSSMGTGPLANSGYDVLFTPLEDSYLLELGTKKGEELVEISKHLLTKADVKVLKLKSIIENELKNKFTTRINTGDVFKVLDENFHNPIWQQLSRDCASCTGCTSLCPTCTCFNVVEEGTGDCAGCRVRYWDSCQSDSFTRNAGEHNPRNDVSRVRYRIYDKFKYIEEKFNYKGCTGCGRCINVCQASINVVEIINKLAENSFSKDNNGGE